MKKDFTKIKKGIRKFLNIFWQHLFLTFIVFVLIGSLFGAMIYYTYYLKVENSGLEVTNATLTVNKVLMSDIFSKWDINEIKAKQAEVVDFPDFFSDTTQVQEEEISTSTTTSTEEELIE